MRLGLDEAIVCRLYKRKSPLTAAHIINIHTATGLSIDEIRHLAGDPKPKHFYQPPKRLEDGTYDYI